MSDSLNETTPPQVCRYLLDPAQFAKLRTRMLIGMAVTGPLFIAAIWYAQRHFEATRDLFDLVFLPGLLLWIAYRQIKTERDKWNSMVLEFDGGKLIRRLPNYPDLEILPGEVKGIVESRQGIFIRTKSPLKYLVVHRALIGYDDLRDRLLTWAPAAKVGGPTPSILTFLRMTASIVGCIMLFGGPLYLLYTPYHELLLPIGIGLISAFVGLILYYQRSPNMPISFHKKSWILVALPVGTMIFRLLGNR